MYRLCVQCIYVSTSNYYTSGEGSEGWIPHSLVVGVTCFSCLSGDDSHTLDRVFGEVGEVGGLGLEDRGNWDPREGNTLLVADTQR